MPKRGVSAYTKFKRTKRVAPARRKTVRKGLTGVRNRMVTGGVGKSMVSRNVHSFVRGSTTVRDLCTGIEQDGAMSFTFADIIGYTDFTNLYDRYMITTVVLKIRLVNNPSATLGLNNLGVAPSTTVNWNATNWFPRLFYTRDADDDTAETVAAMKERATTRMIVLQPNRYYKIVIRPSVLMQAYRTSLTTGYAPKWNNWIDMANTDVPHYGFKYALDTSAQDPIDTYPFRFEIEKKYYFKCKDVR